MKVPGIQISFQRCMSSLACIAIAFMIFINNAKAGSLDSLKTLADNESDPQKKMELLHKISLTASYYDLKAAMREVIIEYNYAHTINDRSSIIAALILKGRLFKKQDLSDSAFAAYETALHLANEINDSNKIARIYNQTGDLYKDMNETSKALEYYNKSYAIDVATKNYRGQFENLNRQAIIYFEQNRFDQAYATDMDVFELSKKIGDEGLIANSHLNLGNFFFIRSNLDSALSHYLITLKHYEKTGGETLANVYVNIGDVYVDKKNYNEALKYFNKALLIAEQFGDHNFLAHLYTSIGRCYALSKSYSIAINFLEKSTAIVSGSKDYQLLAENYGLTADLYAEQNDYKNAFQYQLKVEAAKDSLHNVTSDDKVFELQTRFETFKHEKENDMLKIENDMAKSKAEKQHLLIITLSAAAVFTAFIGLLIYRLFRLRTKKLKSEQTLNSRLELQNLNIERLNNMLEIRAIRAQMDPHFIFNCLASVQHLITKEKIDDAEKYIVKFSRLLRMVLENAEKNTVSLDKEIEMLKLYLDLESIRMNENFRYEINVDDALLEDNIKVPTLVIQPFAENAIWHGLAEKKDNRLLRINIEVDKNVLRCIIEDNGVGRKQSGEKNNKKEHESKAVKMITERLKIIRAQSKVAATGIETIDLFDEHQQPAGTKVIIQLPVTLRA